MKLLIALTHDNSLVITMRFSKIMIVFYTMGFSINPIRLSLKVVPTMIGLASIKLDAMWKSVGYSRSNEVGFGLFKIGWTI